MSRVIDLHGSQGNAFALMAIADDFFATDETAG